MCELLDRPAGEGRAGEGPGPAAGGEPGFDADGIDLYAHLENMSLESQGYFSKQGINVEGDGSRALDLIAEKWGRQSEFSYQGLELGPLEEEEGGEGAAEDAEGAQEDAAEGEAPEAGVVQEVGAGAWK